MRREAPGLGAELQRLTELLAKLPGLGPRSARRAALHLVKRKEALMLPLAAALEETAELVRPCSQCGNLDTEDPCVICRNPARATGLLCVVAEVGDLWALERAHAVEGRYHVLGGLLSALDGVGPEDLRIAQLMERAASGEVREVVLALNATVDGQTTVHYLTDALARLDVGVTQLAHGVPVGGELDYLDEGTLSAAIRARRPL